jgi:DNA polymerase III epsilon subunit-like protein
MAKDAKMIVTVFDTETTGLIINPARKLNSQPEIISIAIQIVNLETGEFFDHYYNVFKPTRPISEEITKITGFTNETVADAPSIKDHLEEIISRLQLSPNIIGQNLDYDKSMIELECDRYGKLIYWPRSIDLVANTIHLKGYRLSLKNLHIELFGKEFTGAHHASVDVEMTCKCAIELFKRGLL